MPGYIDGFCVEHMTATVKHEGFKTCDQSGFCKRNRAYADHAATLGDRWISPYILVGDSVKISDGQVTATLLKSIGDHSVSVQLPVKITLLESGAVRVTVDELKRRQGDIELRHNSQARKERYNEAQYWALVGPDRPDSESKGETSLKETIVKYGPNRSYRAVISHAPFSIDFFRDGEIQVKLNGKGLMNMEHWRPKVEKPQPVEGEEPNQEEPKVEESEDESTWWDETFGGNTDSKPKGPESVGLDVTFPGYQHVYGIPGHASSLSLKETR